jgi:hypothetical protein
MYTHVLNAIRQRLTAGCTAPLLPHGTAAFPTAPPLFPRTQSLPSHAHSTTPLPPPPVPPGYHTLTSLTTTTTPAHSWSTSHTVGPTTITTNTNTTNTAALRPDPQKLPGSCRRSLLLHLLISGLDLPRAAVHAVVAVAVRDVPQHVIPYPPRVVFEATEYCGGVL